MRSFPRPFARRSLLAALSVACLLASPAQATPKSEKASPERMRVQVFTESNSTPLIDSVLPLREEGASTAEASTRVPYVGALSRDGKGRLSLSMKHTLDGAFVSVARTNTPGVYRITIETRSTELRPFPIPPVASEGSPEFAEASDMGEAALRPAPEGWGEEWLASQIAEGAGEIVAESEQEPTRMDLPFVQIRASSFQARLTAGSPKANSIELGDQRARVVATLLKGS